MAEDFKQTWWDENLGTLMKDFLGWVGDHHAMSKKFVRNYVESRGYRSIVDIGCGPATEFTGYKEDRYRISWVGVDSSSILHKRAVDNKVPVLLGEVNNLPLPDKSRDVAFSRHVLEHLPNFKDALREHIRVASKEVIVVFFMPPTDATVEYNYTPSANLHHNRYCKKDIEEFCRLSKRVKSVRWQSLPPHESVMFIDVSG